jgi:phospholipid/cholesterol/gamma-HCH transport system substrate-binding protein
MTRVIREHLRDFIAILALIAAAIFSVFVILSGQKASIPDWVPLVGSDRFELKAEFSSAQSVTPGQGQSVVIAGIRIGDVNAVELDQGSAVVTMEVDDKYAPLIHDDATLLLRPKTGLNDMVVQMNPGSAPGTVEEGDTIPLDQTQPNVNPDEFLATLDADTRSFLKLLLAGGAEGLGGRHGLSLSATLRRLDPTVRDLARINGALVQRRESIAGSIHNFRLVADQLADNDQTVADFVTSSNDVLESFARQEASLRAIFRRLPGSLRQTRLTLDSADRFSRVARPALTRLLPFARALGPALQETRPFLRRTLRPVRDQIRPFTRKVQTPVRHLRQLSGKLANTTPPLSAAFRSINHLFNALAYNPPGSQEGYLFWVPWLNHNTNSLFRGQDAHGPVRMGSIVLGCRTAQLADLILPGTPFLKTLFDLNQLPTTAEIC